MLKLAVVTPSANVPRSGQGIRPPRRTPGLGLSA
jgi:hypothetical protein